MQEPNGIIAQEFFCEGEFVNDAIVSPIDGYVYDEADMETLYCFKIARRGTQEKC